MVVFPELSVSESALEPEEQAENIPGELTCLFSRLAKNMDCGLFLVVYMKNQGQKFITHLLFFHQKVILLENIVKGFHGALMKKLYLEKIHLFLPLKAWGK